MCEVSIALLVMGIPVVPSFNGCNLKYFLQEHPEVVFYIYSKEHSNSQHKYVLYDYRTRDADFIDIDIRTNDPQKAIELLQELLCQLKSSN